MSRRIGDFVKSEITADTKISIEELLGKDFELLEVHERQGAKGKFHVYVGKFADRKETFAVSCGGMVVMRKIAEALLSTKLPLTVKIVKEKTYYDIV